MLFHMKTTVNLRYFVNGYLRKLFFGSKSPQSLSILSSLNILVTGRHFKHFQLKIGAVQLRKVAQISLTW